MAVLSPTLLFPTPPPQSTFLERGAAALGLRARRDKQGEGAKRKLIHQETPPA